MNPKCSARSDLYKRVASSSIEPDNVCLGTIDGNFKQRFYNHKKSFNNSTYRNATTLSNTLWDIKKKKKQKKKTIKPPF